MLLGWLSPGGGIMKEFKWAYFKVDREDMDYLCNKKTYTYRKQSYTFDNMETIVFHFDTFNVFEKLIGVWIKPIR